MPDLAPFAAFAASVGAVPHVPRRSPPKGTGRGTDKIHILQAVASFVPRVPLVPPENSDAGTENDLLEAYEERAAIYEYDCELPRREAEARAWRDSFGNAPHNRKAGPLADPS